MTLEEAINGTCGQAVLNRTIDDSASSGDKGWSADKLLEQFPPKSGVAYSILNDNEQLRIYSTKSAHNVRGNGAHVSGNNLPLLFTDTGANIPEGFIVHLFGYSYRIELDSSDLRMGSFDSFTLGIGTGSYTGCTMTLRGGKWELVSLGQARA